jgi:hypothetical protein
MAPGLTNGKNGASHAAAIDAERAKSTLSFKELLAPGLSVEVELKAILASIQSPFQKVEVLDTYFGKVRPKSINSTRRVPQYANP